MDDSISRQAAIVQLSHNKTGDDDCDVVIQNDIETIKALPSTQPEQRWIPVTERLPEKGQKCLVSDRGCVAIDVFLGRGGVYNWQFYLRDYEAWMPMPEPYKRGEK